NLVLEGRQQRPPRSRFRDELQDRVGHDAEHALASDPQVAEIESRRELLRRRSPLDELAGRQKALQGDDEVTRYTILPTVHATGIAGDVATNGAVLLGGRIRRVKPSLLVRCTLDVSDLRSRLHVRKSGVGIDLDPV